MLNALPPVDGFFTQEYCVKARYFQPKNGQRVDAAREAIERVYRSSWLYFPLLSALILAADRVDSTTGVQMAYLKDWARRSHAELTIQNPRLLPGVGSAIRGDALEKTGEAQCIPPADVLLQARRTKPRPMPQREHQDQSVSALRKRLAGGQKMEPKLKCRHDPSHQD